MAASVESQVEAGGEKTSFEAGGAEEGLLREGHTFEGKKLLGVDGLVESYQISGEMCNLVQVFQADDGEGGGSEAV